MPAYSPHAVAEFTIGLPLRSTGGSIALGLVRAKTIFALDGLVGRNLHGRVAGVVGTWRIGALVTKILKFGFGLEVLACGPQPGPEIEATGVRYVPREELLATSEIVGTSAVEEGRALANQLSTELMR